MCTETNTRRVVCTYLRLYSQLDTDLLHAQARCPQVGHQVGVEVRHQDGPGCAAPDAESLLAGHRRPGRRRPMPRRALELRLVRVRARARARVRVRAKARVRVRARVRVGVGVLGLESELCLHSLESGGGPPGKLDIVLVRVTVGVRTRVRVRVRVRVRARFSKG